MCIYNSVLLSDCISVQELEDSSFCYALKHSSAIIKSNAFVELDGLCVKQLVLKMAENGAFKSQQLYTVQYRCQYNRNCIISFSNIVYSVYSSLVIYIETDCKYLWFTQQFSMLLMQIDRHNVIIVIIMYHLCHFSINKIDSFRFVCIIIIINNFIQSIYIYIRYVIYYYYQYKKIVQFGTDENMPFNHTSFRSLCK